MCRWGGDEVSPGWRFITIGLAGLGEALEVCEIDLLNSARIACERSSIRIVDGVHVVSLTFVEEEPMCETSPCVIQSAYIVLSLCCMR